MKIKTVSIKNFRTIYDAKFDFYDVTSYIGPNGVGKSTVLYALDWFFNGDRAGELTSDDATYGHEDEDIVVSVTFDTLTSDDRIFLGKYCTQQSNTFTAWKMRHDDSEVLSANVMGFEPFNKIKSPTLNATEMKTLYGELRDEYSDLPDVTTKSKIQDALVNWEEEHPNQLVRVPEEVSTSFNGFNSNASMANRFTFSLVRADLRANEESEDDKNSLLGLIIERSLDRKSADEELKEAFSKVVTQEEDIYNNVFGTEISNVSKSLNEVVAEYSNARSISIHPNIQDIRPPKTTFSIAVNDGDLQTSVNHQGHGFQRTLLIASLQMLAEKEINKSNGTLCLAIEEPELYQYPSQAKAFARVLRVLAEDDNKAFQVVYATHSQYFLDSNHIDQVYRLVRSNVASQTMETQEYHANFQTILERISGFTNQKNMENVLKSIYTNNLTEALFARKVILVEGTTDKAIIRGITDLMEQACTEKRGIEIVECQSKGNIIYFHAILQAFGIPVFTMFDNDSGWAKRFKKNEDKRKAAEENHVRSNTWLIKYFGLQVDNRFPKSGKHEHVYVVEDTLESLLREHWEGWSEAFVQIQKEMGIDGRKSSEPYYQAVMHLDLNTCPEGLRQFVDGVVENN